MAVQNRQQKRRAGQRNREPHARAHRDLTEDREHHDHAADPRKDRAGDEQIGGFDCHGLFLFWRMILSEKRFTLFGIMR
jgi:hypothetical protein